MMPISICIEFRFLNFAFFVEIRFYFRDMIVLLELESTIYLFIYKLIFVLVQLSLDNKPSDISHLRLSY